MIDIENNIYTKVKEGLGENIHCAKEYVPFTNEFPLVTVMCIGNEIVSDCIDSAKTENLARITIEVNAYSNKQSGKLEESKQIIKSVSDIMIQNGLVRTMYSQTPNLDTSVARMTARFVCKTDGTNMYRR